MESYKIEITDRANSDIVNIYSYIASTLKEPVIALNQIDRIEAAIDSLATLPERIALVSDPNLANEGYRKLLVDNYYVFFKIDLNKSIIMIIRILYARRDWQSII